MQLDYQDDYEIFDNFQLTLVGNTAGISEEDQANYTFNLETTNEPQTVETQDEEGMQIIDIITNTFDYTLTYLNLETRETITAETGYLSFENSLESAFSGVTSDYYVHKEGYDSFMPIKLDFNDEAGIYSDFNIVFNDILDSDSIIYFDNTNQWQFLVLTSLVESHPDIFDDEVNMKIYCSVHNLKTDEYNDKLLYEDNVTCEYVTDVSKAYGLYIRELGFDEYNPMLSFSYVYLDDNEIFSNFSCVIETYTGNRYEYTLGYIESVYVMNGYIQLDEHENYATLLEELKTNGACNIYLKYDEYDASKDETTTKEVLSSENIIIEVFSA